MRRLPVFCLMLLFAALPLPVARGWSNGAYTTSCGQSPAYIVDTGDGLERGTMGTHDFLAETALGWTKDMAADPFVWSWLDGNSFYFYLGTEAPDNGNVVDCIGMTPPDYDEWGDTTKHHVYLQQDGRPCPSEDDAADRAQECFDAAVTALQECRYPRAAFYFGAMTHYLVDMTMYAHVLDDDACYRTYTNQEEDPCHSPVEDWIDDLIQDSRGEALTLLFDGDFKSWDTQSPAYYAALEAARITDQGNINDVDPLRRGFTRPCDWMMDHCREWENPDFFMSLQDSLNRGANYIADLIPAAWAMSQASRGCPGLSVNLSQDSFTGGDAFRLALDHWHPGTEQIDIDVYAVLEVHGAYFWFPSWGPLAAPDRRTLFPGSWTQLLIQVSALPSPLPAGGPFFVHAASVQAGSAGALYDWDSRPFYFR